MANKPPCANNLSITAFAKSASQVDSSPLIHENPTTTTKHEDHCIICLDSISDRAVAVPCNHYAFDFICLASWLQEHPTCPLCKARITAVEYDWRGVREYQTYYVPECSNNGGGNGSATTSTGSVAPANRRPGPGPCVDRSLRGGRPERGSNAVQEDPTITFRRYIYKHNLFSLHIGDNTISGFQTITPSTFTSSPALQRKARIWIRRELRVFQYLYHENHVSSGAFSANAGQSRPRARTHNPEFLVEYIVAMLNQLDLRGADGKALDLLTEILGKRQYAGLFCHELEGWLRAPWTRLEDWDEIVQYEVEVPRPKRWNDIEGRKCN